MSRYFIKSAHVATPDPIGGYCEWLADSPPSITVHEQDLETWTGLLDMNGDEIHRCEKIKLGFHLPGKD